MLIVTGNFQTCSKIYLYWYISVVRVLQDKKTRKVMTTKNYFEFDLELMIFESKDIFCTKQNLKRRYRESCRVKIAHCPQKVNFLEV